MPEEIFVIIAITLICGVAMVISWAVNAKENKAEVNEIRERLCRLGGKSEY